MSLLAFQNHKWPAGGGGGYTQNFIDTNGTGRISTTTAPGNSSAFTASVWVRPFNTTNVGTLFSAIDASSIGVRLFMFNNGGNLEFRWIIHDSAAAAAWIGMSLFGGLSANTVYHAYLAVDLSGGGTFTFLINGSAPSISNISGPTTGSGTVRLSQPIDVTWRDAGAGNPDVWDGRVSDLFFQAGSIIPYSNFHDGANGPTDITGVGSPFLLLGDTMTADERAGNTAQGWNDGFNIGSASMSVLSGTYTDA